MDSKTRFYRAMGVPDGLVTDDAKARFAGKHLVKPSSYVEDNPNLADRTAAHCVEFLQERYTKGMLDGFLLGDDSVEHVKKRLVADLMDGYLREQLSGSGSIVQPTSGLPEVVVEDGLARLRDYVAANPVDSH